MKKQKKYVTRDMILKDIDRAHRKMERLKKEAALQDELSREWAKMACVEPDTDKSTGQIVKSEASRDEANRLWDSAKRIDQTRLPKLQRTLAAFDTQPMFGDEQVVLQQK